MVSARILERMVHDIRWLLSPAEESMELEEAIYLWDNQRGVVSNGINYFREEEGDGPLSSSP